MLGKAQVYQVTGSPTPTKARGSWRRNLSNNGFHDRSCADYRNGCGIVACRYHYRDRDGNTGCSKDDLYTALTFRRTCRHLWWPEWYFLA